MQRAALWRGAGPPREGARYTLYHALIDAQSSFSRPFLPYVTEEIYCGLFAANEDQISLHLTRWPQIDPTWINPQAEDAGEILLEVATAVRRYKSAASISLGSEFKRLLISTRDVQLTLLLEEAGLDILSVTRARELRIGAGIALNGTHEIARHEGVITIGLEA